jgi:Na+/H+ antiporter NhaC
MEYGFWSVIPPIIAIALAIRTRQVFVSIFAGIWIGWVIINEGNLLTGTLDSIQALVDVFKDAGNTRTILFGALVGALIVFIQRSGGVQGFIDRLEKRLKKYEEGGGSKRIVQLLAFTTGILIFVESNISSLTVGTLYRPIFDKLKISREKLAYLADSSSAPSSILIPFNGWGAFIMSLLLAQGFEHSFQTLIRSTLFNFYPMAVILLGFYLISRRKDFGPMAKAEKRAAEEGKLVADDSQPMISDELTSVEIIPQEKYKARNMIIPIAAMVIMMPIMLAYTGWSESSGDSFFGQLFSAIGKGSGSTSVLIAVLFAILLSMVLYKWQGLMRFREMIDLILKGVSGMVPLAVLMMLAFAIGAICKELDTGNYVAEVSKAWLSPSLVPAIVFLVSCFIAFATGTSWGTFAIMIAIAVPMAQGMDANVYMAIAAALGGGVFGDHCSPISDTSIVSSMASASDHIDHVRTQLPYALIAGGIAFVLYLILGFLT